MEKVVFLVQGSAAEPYAVTVYKEEAKLSATCSCPAGSNGQVCKHRLSILQGSNKGVVGHNIADITTVTRWMQGSALASAIAQLEKEEIELERAKNRVADAKKHLSAEMRP